MKSESLTNKNNIVFTKDSFLGGALQIFQPKTGFRAGTDSIFLAAFANVKNNTKVAELGCGVGTVALALALRVKYLKVTAFEINEEIFEVAKKNISLNNLSNCVEVIRKDIKLLPKQSLFTNTFDIVLSNPPFYKKNTSKPAEDSLRAEGFIESTANLEDFIKSANFILKNKGYFYVIHIAERLDEVIFLLKKYGFGAIEILGLYSFNNNIASRVIVKARKGSKGYSKLLPPFIVHNKEGFSKKASSVLNTCSKLTL